MRQIGRVNYEKALKEVEEFVASEHQYSNERRFTLARQVVYDRENKIRTELHNVRKSIRRLIRLGVSLDAANEFLIAVSREGASSASSESKAAL